jgi:transposase-like protein
MECLLADDELKELQRIQRKFTTHRSRYIKATVLIMLHRKFSVSEIEDLLGIDDNSVYRYAKAFRQVGLEEYLNDHFKPCSELLG